MDVSSKLAQLTQALLFVIFAACGGSSSFDVRFESPDGTPPTPTPTPPDPLPPPPPTPPPPVPTPTPTPHVALFTDALATGVLDMSSAVRHLASTAEVHGGTQAIALEPDRRLALHFVFSNGLDAARYDTLEMWVHGGSAGRQRVRLAVLQDRNVTAGVELGSLLSAGFIAANEWQRVRVSLAALGARGNRIDGLWLGGLERGDQPTMYLDDLVFASTGQPPPAGTPLPPTTPAASTIVVDPEADRRPVSPLVYGANFGSAAQLEKQRFPVRRWGGNHTSRYAWDVDAANRAMDWFFMSIPENNANPAALPYGSAANRFVDETLAAGSEVLLTVPMIGWVPKDRTERWSYSVRKYGSQQAANGDAGNGRQTSGAAITWNDPHDASRPVGPEYVSAWLTHLTRRLGPTRGGVRYFSLDNEVTLWPSTHRDVHPHNVTYGELWDKTRAYASAIKAQAPDAELFGPVAYGWCGYFGVEGECSGGPERRAYGDLIPWYLQQVCAHQRETGVRLVDYLTVHYYPQQARVYSQDESAATQALRLRSVRSLYDPAYADESWVPEPVQLIPRMQRWIAAHCPGMKLAITEYSFGAENGLTGALAQAEALAIFGREGLDLATRWTAPNDGQRVEDGFALFRNYDGAGATVDGDSVRAVSWDKTTVASYAIRDGQRLFVLLFNKATTSKVVRVEVRGGARGPVKVYGFDAGQRQGARGEVAAGATGVDLTLPARSATLAVTALPN